ncbi:hypothetical protein [Komagataeibacter xylinus]|uniref:hypothetical protein n=1 Tax=Komagataeibacter xylinus TaxID=28448 RepID=UPI00280C15D0|nr:hypothetical protein [Komagataeibacter xylinus]
MAVNWKSLLATVFPLVGTVIATATGGTLATYNATAQTAVKSALTKVDGGVTHLQSLFDTWDAANPLAQEAIAGTVSMLRNLGFTVPTEDSVVTHVQAAIADLAGIYVTPDSTTATASAATATPAAATA